MSISASGKPGGDWVDVEACTLPTAERPLRMAEFDDLFATAVRSLDRVGDTHARLLLIGDAELAQRTRRLVAAETSCCSFFTFQVAEVEPGRVALDIEVPPAYVNVLDGLVTRAEAAVEAAS
jgi:hypothetical protein